MSNYDTRTRGNDFKLVHYRSKLDIKKHSFSNRIVSFWNKLRGPHLGGMMERPAPLSRLGGEVKTT